MVMAAKLPGKAWHCCLHVGFREGLVPVGLARQSSSESGLGLQGGAGGGGLVVQGFLDGCHPPL